MYLNKNSYGYTKYNRTYQTLGTSNYIGYSKNNQNSVQKYLPNNSQCNNYKQCASGVCLPSVKPPPQIWYSGKNQNNYQGICTDVDNGLR